MRWPTCAMITSRTFPNWLKDGPQFALFCQCQTRKEPAMQIDKDSLRAALVEEAAALADDQVAKAALLAYHAAGYR